MVRATALNETQYNNLKIRVGDTYLFKADKKGIPPYVGRVKKIHKSGSEHVLKVNWLYRPEEAIGGRKIFHGSQELFESDHTDDDIPVGSVLSPCRIMEFEAYKALKEVEDDDFYTRFFYKHQAKVFEPDQVAVYCLCEMPDNPDQPMVECDSCKDWYHFECLQRCYPDFVANLRLTSLEDIQKLPSWACPACAAKHQERQQQHHEDHQQLKSKMAAADTSKHDTKRQKKGQSSGVGGVD